MIYSGSIVFIQPENLDAARSILGEFKEIEIHAVGEDKTQIVVSIETENDDNLEELSKKIKSYDEILDIGHHIMHFEEDVEDILSGKKVPDIKAFQRSKRRDKHPLETVQEG
jgi:nitrate reductase NapAB chaperone NapD